MLHFENDHRPTRNSQTPRVFGLVAMFGVMIVAANAIVQAVFG
jgi:hypothetical protein